MTNFSAPDVALIVGLVISLIVIGFAAIVLLKIATNTIPLTGLISEPDDPKSGKRGKASLSRFQFLLFTFVIAGLFLVLSLESGTFVEIPTNVLLLLGISGGSYVVSKTVGNRDQAPKKGDDES